MWLSTLRALGSLAGIAYPKVAKGAADALERLVLEVRRRLLVAPFVRVVRSFNVLTCWT